MWATIPLEKQFILANLHIVDKWLKRIETTWMLQHDEIRANQSYESELMSLSTDANH